MYGKSLRNLFESGSVECEHVEADGCPESWPFDCPTREEMMETRTILKCTLISVFRGVLAWNGRRSDSGSGCTSIHSLVQHQDCFFRGGGVGLLF